MNKLFAAYLSSFVAIAISGILVIISVAYKMHWSIETFFGIMTLLSVCFRNGFVEIGPTSRAIVVFMNKPVRRIDSGLNYILWPFERIAIEISTEIVQYELDEATIITAKKKQIEADSSEELYFPAKIGAIVAINFCWPEDETALIAAFRKFPSLLNPETVRDKLQEPVLDEVRSTGGGYSWREITTNRKAFAHDVLKNIMENESNPIPQAGLNGVNIILKKINLPDDLAKAITAPQIADLAKKAAIQTAEGEKRAAELIGEGAAYARKMLFEAIDNLEVAMQWQTLDTLRGMAEGTSNTLMVLPLQIMDALNNISKKFGTDNALDALRTLFPDISKEMAEKIINMAKPPKK